MRAAGGVVARETRLMRRAVVAGHDGVADRPAHDLLGPPAEDALGGRVPARDAAVAVGGDDGVERRVQHALAQRLRLVEPPAQLVRGGFRVPCHRA
jgi:hypothetical protein